jgi:N-acetyl-gamma-glutamyl-phosphate reductase
MNRAMIRVGIVGATGYTALELIKILLRHPQVQIVALTSRQEGRPHVSSVHRQLSGRLDLELENLAAEELAERCDCVFSCLPHGASAEVVAELIDAGTHVVDFSADYRLDDVQVYRQWYEVEHPDPQRVGQTPYGLPEWFREAIREASLVANPGCYPTSAILALAPLLKERLIDDEDLIVDSKSGVSGAGRTPKLTTHFPECNESVAAYNVGYHRHTPEIEQILSRVTGRPQRIVFTPHLIPMDRGILTTAYGRRREGVTESQLLDAIRQAYATSPFVRVVEHLPATKDTAYTNYCDLSVRVVGERAVVISTIDNLIKGASGVAVQNMNLMFGEPETTALM